MSRPGNSRKNARLRAAFPLGMFTAMLTSIGVTLTGAFLGIAPSTILLRAAISALVMGGLVSLGYAMVQIADSEQKRKRRGRTES